MSASISIHLFYLAALMITSAAAFIAGLCKGQRRYKKTVFIGQWLDAYIQWDSTMSQADVLDFLDKARAHVIANPLAKIKNAKDQCRSNDTAQPEEQARD